jgi:GAF domain-containing protein
MVEHAVTQPEIVRLPDIDDKVMVHFAKAQAETKLMLRESLLVATTVELADNLIDNFDVIDVLTLLSDRCVQTIDVSSAGVLLGLPGGDLQFVTSSSEPMRVLELLQIQANEGPSVDCRADGIAIINRELRDPDERWPRFSRRAIALGFRSVHCLPLRLRGRTIGALNLFRGDTGLLSHEDVVVAQGFADVATIAILQHQSALRARVLNDQLNIALNSRIIIEQAKGMVSHSLQCDIDFAFGRLRAHARNHNLHLTDVATAVVSGTLAIESLVPVKVKSHRDAFATLPSRQQHRQPRVEEVSTSPTVNARRARATS